MQSENLRVLLIEDDEAFGRGLRGMLEQFHEAVAGVEVTPSLTAGLELLAHNHYDVVVLDFFLLDGAGLANISMLRAAAPRVPVIVIGAADDETIAVEAVHAGAQDYLVKSQVSPRWLLRAVHYAIERHRADRALQDAEQQYRGVFDHLVEGIFQTSTEGRYLLANTALARIYGYRTPDELMSQMTDIGRRLYVQPGRREEFKRIMEEHDTITGFESQIFRKDGNIIWISENCRAIRDAAGKLLYYEGTVEDISARREAELKLRDSETLYHSLVETLPQNIFRKDLQERFTFANHQFCKTLGKPLEDIVGKTDYDFFPPELASKYQRDDAQVMSTGRALESVEEHQLPDGSTIYVQVVKTALRGAFGQVIGLQGIFWDITPQKRAEQQIRQANEDLGRSREALRIQNLMMEDDLKMAREIQLTLLPQQYPTFPPGAAVADSAFQFTHRYHPTGTVGGDFFAVSALTDTEVAVFICDVAGHGVRSALITAMIRALVEELKPLADEPGAFLTKLNYELGAILKHTGTPVLTTAFYLVADARTGRARFANAGHPKPLLVQRHTSKVFSLKSAAQTPQPALGLIDQATYQTTEISLAPTDLVLLFTDGLFEVESPAEEMFSQDQLAAAVRRHHRLATPALFDQVLADVRVFAGEHQFDDDVCMVGVELARLLPAGPAAPPANPG